MSSYTTSVMNVRHHDHIDIPSVQYDERVLAREKLANSVGNETILPFEPSVNPTQLGLMGFTITGFVMGVTKTGIVVDVPVISVGACLTSGFLSQIIAGILEIRIGNTFGAIAFILYGCFSLSYGIILLPGSGFFSAAEAKGLQTVNYAIGLFELPWLLFAIVLSLVLCDNRLLFVSSMVVSSYSF